MSIDQIIALISSIGTCIATILVLLTLFEMQKQRRHSCQPTLIFGRAVLIANGIGDLKKLFCGQWTLKDNDADNANSNPYIILYNIGLGAAKSIIVEWEFSVDEFVKLAPDRLCGSPYNVEKVDNYLGEFIITAPGATMHFFNTDHKHTFDYCMPVSQAMDQLKIPIPNGFLSLTSLLIHTYHESKGIPMIPHITAKISYSDIGGQTYSNVFNFKLKTFYVTFDPVSSEDILKRRMSYQGELLRC